MTKTPLSLEKYLRKDFKNHLVRLNEGYTKVPGTQGGSNSGGQAHDAEGNKYYIKHYQNEEQAKSEALAGKIYHHMGIDTLQPNFEKIDNKPSIVTRWNEGLTPMKTRDFDSLDHEQAKTMGKIYHAGVLTKNWDIIGTGLDYGEGNMQKHEDGRIFNIDHGAAFHFRAQGAPKEYDDGISEKNTFRDHSKTSGEVFNKVFSQHPHAEKAGLEAVRNMDMDHIQGLFQNSGLKNWKTLHQNFVTRREKLLKSYE